MAYRRSITARSNLFYHHRLSPSISHSHRHHNVSENSEASPSPISRNPQVRNYIHHRFLLGAGNYNFSNYRRFAVPAGYGMACGRNYWSEADKTEVLSQVVGVLGDKAVEVAPVANEVAVAAADSFPPVAAFQYLIDYVHCFTGLSWWASIAATTIIVRLLHFPFVINTMTSRIIILKSLMAMADEILKKVRDEMSKKGGLCSRTFAEARVKLEALEEHRAAHLQTTFYVSVYCTFFFAVLNMAKKVPSFKEGGALWFTDLTTPDTLCVLPVLTALTCWHKLERIFPDLGYPKLRGQVNSLVALTFLVAVCSPKAILCFWITSNLFSIVVYGLVIKNPQVKKLLGIQVVASTNQKSKNGGKERK